MTAPTPRLEDPLTINDCTVENRLYRAPLLECAGNGPDAVETLIADLEPAAAAGAGLIHQGATIVRGTGGCAAPNMTRVHDPEFVESLGRVPEAIHDHGGRIFIQLEHGGLRSMETWHAEYREAHPDLEQLAPSGLPWQLRLLDRLGFLDYDPHVLSTEAVYELAADFGRAAGRAVEAGYDGIHLAGANMGLIQQFLSPYYNRRDDEFGGSLAARARFLEVLYEEIRDRVGTGIPIITKIPAETEAPPFVRRHLSLEDGIELCERAVAIGYDALVPVNTSVYWDMSIVRGEYPDRAWKQSAFQSGYRRVFGSRLRARLVSLLSWLESFQYTFEPAWNADYCRAVRDRVDVPILCEGGIRERDRIDRLLGDACDLVGLGRPFYAEPRLPARLLDATDDVAVICENCNNCTIPQVTGEAGVCRTPSVLRRRGELEQADAYDR